MLIKRNARKKGIDLAIAIQQTFQGRPEQAGRLMFEIEQEEVSRIRPDSAGLSTQAIQSQKFGQGIQLSKLQLRQLALTSSLLKPQQHTLPIDQHPQKTSPLESTLNAIQNCINSRLSKIKLINERRGLLIDQRARLSAQLEEEKAGVAKRCRILREEEVELVE